MSHISGPVPQVGAARRGCLRHVLVMAKSPVPGKVKTRLCPPLSPHEAAAVAEAALADTLEAVLTCHADQKVVALDGRPGPWLPPGIEVVAQSGDGLDERLARAWAEMHPATGGWGIQIGMDTPQVTADILDQQLDIISAQPSESDHRQRAVLGRADDGGWWLIGLPGTDPYSVFAGIAMSTSQTGAAQARRLRSLGLEVCAAPVLRDIDTAEDLRVVAAQAPDTRTAAVAGIAGRADGGRQTVGVV